MMLYLFEHFGVAVGAISGVLAAAGKRIDLFGVTVLALVAALGGGTLRDLTLGAAPVFWIRDPNYVVTGAGTALIMFLIARRWMMPEKMLAVADAFVLALFTMLGAEKAMTHGAGSINAVVLGVITGVAGGIFRDVLVGQIPLVFRPGTFLYATAAFVGAIVFVLLDAGWPHAPRNFVIGTVLTLLVRLGSIRWRITLPVYDHHSPPP
jgi:uncharacterized membrane protein YeiH